MLSRRASAKLTGVVFLLLMVPNVVLANAIPQVPSLDAISSSASALRWSSVPTINANIAPTYNGPTVSAAGPTYVVPAEESQSDTDFAVDFTQGVVLDKFVFDQLGIADAGIWARSISELGIESYIDLALGSSVNLWDVAGALLGEAGSAWLAPLQLLVWSSSTSEGPETSPPYSGLQYNPDGQYIPVNSETPPSDTGSPPVVIPTPTPTPTPPHKTSSCDSSSSSSSC
jgi:hypothetical protein